MSDQAYVEVHIEVLYVYLPVWSKRNAIDAKQCLVHILVCNRQERNVFQ